MKNPTTKNPLKKKVIKATKKRTLSNKQIKFINEYSGRKADKLQENLNRQLDEFSEKYKEDFGEMPQMDLFNSTGACLVVKDEDEETHFYDVRKIRKATLSVSFKNSLLGDLVIQVKDYKGKVKNHWVDEIKIIY